MTHKIDESGKPLRAGWWILAIIVFGLSIAIRIRLLGVPLERDEGEYAYAGQLILQGVPPYTLAYNMKFPGTYAAYAAIMSIFGQTITGIHLGLLLVNAATIVLIFLVGRQFVNSVVGLAAGMSYGVSVSPSVLGFAGHATHFVLLPVLGGTLRLLKATNRQAFGSLFASGMPGILLSIALFHFGAPSRFAARRRCHQQIIGPQCRSINRSPIYPHLNSGTCHCLADARRKKVLFEASPADASRMIYPESPFPESIRIAEYLRERTTRNDTIAVLGSEPQIYFYSDRHSATGYVYTYGLMEP